MTTLEAIVGPDTFNLSDRLSRWHLGNDGFGLPDAERFEEQGASQHGTTDTGFRLVPRIVQLELLTGGSDEDDYWTSRDDLLYIFSPRDDPFQLRFTYAVAGVDRVRQLDVHYKGGLSLPSSERKGGVAHRVRVACRANDPTWYDPTGVTVPFGLAGGAGAMNVPLAIPWNVGSSTLDQTAVVDYSGGTWDAFPIFTIYGPITNPVITHQVSGDVLDFTGTTIAAANYYTVDLRYGYKRVYKNGNPTDNRIHELDQATSSLATFRLMRRPDAPDGLNPIQVEGSAVTEATQVYLDYNTRYIGL